MYYYNDEFSSCEVFAIFDVWEYAYMLRDSRQGSYDLCRSTMRILNDATFLFNAHVFRCEFSRIFV